MYFDASALRNIFLDESGAALISGDRKPVTSPLAVIEATLALAASGTPGGNATEIEAALRAFIDGNGIELRELPPTTKLIEYSLAAGGTDPLEALHAACAKYYEVEPFRPGGNFSASPTGFDAESEV